MFLSLSHTHTRTETKDQLLPAYDVTQKHFLPVNVQ
jgi:hypothetical protein